MRAETLFNLSQPRGVDLKQVAGNSSNTEGVAARRPLTAQERRDGITEVPLSATGTASRVACAAEWQGIDLGHALAGAPEVIQWACLYHINGDYGLRSRLFNALMGCVPALAKRNGWPTKVGRTDGTHSNYYADVVDLVLDEDANKPKFTDHPELYAAHLKVSKDVWDKTARHWFDAVQAKFQAWSDGGVAWVNKRAK